LSRGGCHRRGLSGPRWSLPAGAGAVGLGHRPRHAASTCPRPCSPAPTRWWS